MADGLTLTGICSYSDSHSDSSHVGGDMILNGIVKEPKHLDRLNAEFDHIHINRRRRSDNYKRFVVGSLTPRSDVYLLAVHVRDMISKEFLGHFNFPHFNPMVHHSSKPHLTLCKD